MHSNWKIWDLVKSRPEIIDKDSPRIIALQTWDPFAFKLIKQRIPKTLFAGEELNVKSSHEVTNQWIEDNLKSLGLFGNKDSYLFLMANGFNKDAKTTLINIDELIVDERYVLFEFLKEDDLLKKIKNHPKVELIKVQAPGFWEHDKLVNFLCDELQVYLDLSAKDFLMNTIEMEISVLYNILMQIGINFPDKVNITKDDISPLLNAVRSDQFEMANFFATKKIKLFYDKIIRISDFNDLRQVFMFLQSHLLKVLDPSYTEGKARLTKYDKEILSQSKIWSKADLNKALNYFSKLEIMAKRKDQYLFHYLKKDQLRFF